MTESAKILIAPCGMNCALCSGYLAYKNKIPRQRGKIHYCTSCRVRNKQCAFLKGHCQKIAKNKIKFCFECGSTFPCDHLKRIDERYRKKYSISMIANLKEIRDKGMEKFLENQKKKHGCAKCGRMVSVHNKKCFKCAKINSWKD
jgi:hypothetical protein